MAKDDDSDAWGLASASLVGTVLEEAGITVTAQDADLRYFAVTRPPLGFSGSSIVGCTDSDVFINDTLKSVIDAKQRALNSSERQHVEVKVVRTDGDRWLRMSIEPLLAGAHVPGVLTTAVDITPQKLSEEHLRLALVELAHRSKNLLSVVLSIARQSTEESVSLGDFSARFVGRIRALGLAHDVLTDELWRGATVFNLVRSQLSSFQAAPRQSTVEGHNAYLKPNAVQHVGLALHELIAQSIISGALANPNGRIVVSSSVVPAETEGTPTLVLVWRETGIAPSENAAKSPFGRALLERIVPAALNGQAMLDESNAGILLYELRIPDSQFF